MFVTIVMPALNEERFIAGALESITRLPPSIGYELLVMDGGSTDSTRDLVALAAAANPAIRLHANPARIQSAAVNRAAELADPRATVLLRADCHALYPAGFVETCCEQLAETQAVSVVVPMLTKGDGCFQRAVAALQNGLLGNGGSPHRRRKTDSRFVEHGHHAAFDRRFFQSVGGYDESFTHNEDAELDIRIGAMGGRIWLEASKPVIYFPRSTPLRLARQYFNHGRGRCRTVLKHRTGMRLRQLLPLFAVLGSLFGLLLSPAVPALLLPALIYIGACCAVGVTEAMRQRDRCLLGIGPAAVIIHAAWTAGFVSTWVRHQVRLR